ncbi:ribonuclease P protein component [Persicobacter diffluens]|uniref:Ribonuclease P protein component n=1 Tax=Persicobacter diffluens TaxID=981 RepID=A0AAN4VY44_9BACT|nr:hypothetical protein PEDI_27330 [Persicobacter diffluens]
MGNTTRRPGSFTLCKAERLCSKKSIQELFYKGSSFFLHPMKVVFLPASQPETDFHQVLFSVPKKKHKHAVDRNAVKRRLREAYRLHKTELLSPETHPALRIGFIYTSPKMLPYQEIEKQMRRILKKIHHLVNEVKESETPD